MNQKDIDVISDPPTGKTPREAGPRAEHGR